MGSSSNAIMQFLENKTILITGGTGFLAKIFLEKILRIQPNVARIYLLIRVRGPHSVENRFQNEVIAKDLFKVLREIHGENFDSFISRKVVPVVGDISDHNLGVNDPNMREQMWRQLNIIVNFAATTNFDERYDVAMDINTFGAMNVLTFAKKCQDLKIFLHVSTAYVCGEKPGIILEKPLEMGKTLNGNVRFNINEERKVAEEMLGHLRAHEPTEKAVKEGMSKFGIERARLHGWPNTYVFTKAMGEMLLEKFKNDVPLIILRPTMVTSTYQQPFPGWIEGVRTIDAIIAGFGKGKIKCLPYDQEAITDVIPADMVINLMLVATIVRVNCSSKIIYHIGSSSTNPVNFSNLQDFSIDYFTKKPLTDKSGKKIEVKKVIKLNTMAQFQIFMMICYLLPLKVLQIINIITCQHFKELYDDYNRKIKSVIRLANLYLPYMFLKTIFDVSNSEELKMIAREMGLIKNKKVNEDDDDDGFEFDPMSIDWKYYFINTHILGLVHYEILKKP